MIIRNTGIILLIFIVFNSCTFGQKSSIKIRLKDTDATNFNLGYFLGENRYIRDTVVAEKGVIDLSYDPPITPGIYFLYSSDPPFYQEFVINESNFEITTDGSFKNFRVKNSLENSVYKEFQLSVAPLQRRMKILSDSLADLSGPDSVATRELIVQTSKSITQNRKNIVKKYPNLLASKMIALLDPIDIKELNLNRDTSNSSKNNYWVYKNAHKKRLDFSERGLLRTPIFKSSVMEYITKTVLSVPDSIKIELDDIFNAVIDDSISFQFWLTTFTEHYQEAKFMGSQAVLVHLLDTYYLSGKAKWMSETDIERIKQQVDRMRPNQIGMPAPNLFLEDTLGNISYPLKLKNKYLIVYFYDPNCGHCQKQTPILWGKYEQIKKFNAEVVAVCATDEVKKWKSFIQKYQFQWVNLADPKYQCNFRYEYNIRSYPMTYILDKERKIIARKIPVANVVSFLNQYNSIQ